MEDSKAARFGTEARMAASMLARLGVAGAGLAGGVGAAFFRAAAALALASACCFATLSRCA
jgi:hypothetical protein